MESHPLSGQPKTNRQLSESDSEGSGADIHVDQNGKTTPDTSDAKRGEANIGWMGRYRRHVLVSQDTLSSTPSREGSAHDLTLITHSPLYAGPGWGQGQHQVPGQDGMEGGDVRLHKSADGWARPWAADSRAGPFGTSCFVAALTTQILGSPFSWSSLATVGSKCRPASSILCQRPERLARGSHSPAVTKFQLGQAGSRSPPMPQ